MAALLASSIVLIATASAAASVRLGPDLTPVGDGLGYGCPPGNSSPCSFVNLHSTNPAVLDSAPSNGVITKWRFRAGCCTEKQTESLAMTLKTFKPGFYDGQSGYSFIVPVRTGPSFVLEPGNQVIADPAVELPARVPIAKGERIGIVADSPIAFASYAVPNVKAAFVASGVFYQGEAYGVTYFTAIAINADIEPDTDGDGYGDETQDCHPGDPTQSGDCSPPVVASPPPAPLIVGKHGPCEGNCGGGGVVFSHAPQSIPGPRGDGGIVVFLSCPPAATVPCVGILYAKLPGERKGHAAATSAAPAVLAQSHYSVRPGKKKSVSLIFSKKVRAYLSTKTSRRVIVTIQPKGGQPTSTVTTVRFPKAGKRH
jgi:hypothetical protein